MPRIFHVTFTREFEAAIVAEDEDELAAALKSQIGDINQWYDGDWEFAINDPLTTVSNPDHIPLKPETPDMGVHDGWVYPIEDYEVDHPNYKQELEQGVRDRVRKLTLERDNLKLPFGE